MWATPGAVSKKLLCCKVAGRRRKNEEVETFLWKCHPDIGGQPREVVLDTSSTYCDGSLHAVDTEPTVQQITLRVLSACTPTLNQIEYSSRHHRPIV